MSKLKNFDLDLKVKKGSKKGVKPAITSVSLCTPGCKTGVFMTCMSNGCK